MITPLELGIEMDRHLPWLGGNAFVFFTKLHFAIRDEADWVKL